MSGAGDRGAKFTWSEAFFLGLVVLVVWVGQEPSGAGPGSLWFNSSFFGVPLNYVLLAGLMLLLLPYVQATAGFSLTSRLKTSGLWVWVVLAWGAVSLALGLALLRGAPELFADWRNLAVMAIVAVVASKWLAAQEWKRVALADLTITLGLLCVPVLVQYTLGFGASVGGVRTTVFDSTTLYIASFVGTAGAWYLLAGSAWLGRVRVVLLGLVTVAASLVVILSLRRSFWVVLGVGILVVLAVQLSSREVQGIRLYAAFLVGLLVVLGAFLALGVDTVMERVESFSPDSVGRFSSTNQDHINDLIDAWAVIEENPILGFGIGIRYETNLIAAWKENSFDVHNAVLHVWLKFGLIGALAYVGFHFAWARYAFRRPVSAAVPIGAFVVGFMVATMAGTWPYGRFQMAVFLGILLAILLVESQQSRLTVVQPQAVDATSQPG